MPRSRNHSARAAGRAAARWGLCGAWLLIATALSSFACAMHEQVQYFAARDPETGSINYYRVVVSGHGGGGVDYRFQAGYFSTAAVDVLRGSMPKVPILDLSPEQLEVYDALAAHFYAALVQESRLVFPVQDQYAVGVASLSMRNHAARRLADAELERSRLKRACDRVAADVTAKTAAANAAQTTYDTAKKTADVDATALEAYTTERNRLAEVVRLSEGVLGEARGMRDGANEAVSRLTTAYQAAEKAASDARVEADRVAGDQNSTAEQKNVAETLAIQAREAADDLKTQLDDATKKANDASTAVTDAENGLSTAKSNLANHVEDSANKQIVGKAAESAQALSAAESALRRTEQDLAIAKELKEWQQYLLDQQVAIRDRYNAAFLVAKKVATNADAALTSNPKTTQLPSQRSPLDDAMVRKLARLIWLGSLSGADLASIGSSQETDPFVFRKLVFWSTAANIDLSQYAADIDGVLDNVISIAQAERTRAQQRKAERKQRRLAFEDMLKRLPAEQAASLSGALQLFTGQAAPNPLKDFLNLSPASSDEEVNP